MVPPVLILQSPYIHGTGPVGIPGRDRMGNASLAITNYEISLELDSNNTNTVQMP